MENIDKLDSLSDPEISELLLKMKELQVECAMIGISIAYADIFGDITNNMIDIIKNKQGLKYPLHVYTNVLGNPAEKSMTEQAYAEVSESQEDSFLKKYFWLEQDQEIQN